MANLLQLLKFATEQGASDLHITNGTPPALRVNGKLVKIKGESLTKEMTQTLCYSVLSDNQKAQFEENRELDFSFDIKNMARFRANYFFQKGAVGGVFRRVPVEVPSFHELGLPSSIAELAYLNNGLVLVTGPTGSGKSTTIASLINKINEEQNGHIMTLEDPIEFVHQHKQCIINQREVGNDTADYGSALRYVLRQDPDYCLLGELRDLGSIEAALLIAETGHLVFATLHTNSSVQTINRVVNVFEPEQQERIRLVLSFVLQGIICQQLLPGKNGGRVAAVEFMLLTPGIRSLIRENKLHQIQSMMQMGQEKTGMITMNQSLFNLYAKSKIDLKTAFGASPDPDALDTMLKKAGI